MSGTTTPAARQIEAKIREYLRNRGEQLLALHAEQIREQMRRELGEVVASVVSMETLESSQEIVIRISVGRA